MPKTISANLVREDFSDVVRRVSEGGEPDIMEQDDSSRVVIISLADYERLFKPQIRSRNRAALDWLEHWLSTPDSMSATWWEKFERELSEHPVTFRES